MKELIEQIKKFLKRLSPLCFVYGILRVFHGRRVYRKLMEKYGENCRIYINHYPGTGDIFLTSMFLPAWLEKQGTAENAVVTVIGVSGRKVAELFPLPCIELLSHRETFALIKFYEFSNRELPIEILHFHAHAINTSILEHLACYKGLDFLQIYLSTVFPGLTMEDAVQPAYEHDDAYMQKVFEENGLEMGRTVLLVPHANTTTPLSDEFWYYLAKGLQDKGYCVCTNAGGKKETAIPGTKSVFLPYKHLAYFLECAGATIQLRCGLSDLIAMAKCRKIVLYPRENYFLFGTGNFYDYFSINQMGLCHNAEEYQFNHHKEERALCREILRSFDPV